MASRKKRKRYRQQSAAAEATARPASPSGGRGDCAYVKRSDWLLVRKAIREQWPTSAAARGRVVDQATTMLDDPATSTRLLFAVMRTLVAVQDDNLRRYEELVGALGRLEAARRTAHDVASAEVATAARGGGHDATP